MRPVVEVLRRGLVSSVEIQPARDCTNSPGVNRSLEIATHHYLPRRLLWVLVVPLRMVHAAEPTNTPAPTLPSALVAVQAAGVATNQLTAALAVSPNSGHATAALTPFPPTALAVPTARHARASVKANVAAHPAFVELTTVSAVLAVSLCSELANPLLRT